MLFKSEHMKEIIPGKSAVKLGARRFAFRYANAVKNIRLAILAKVFPEQILIHEEQGTIEGRIVMVMHMRWSKEIVFTRIHFDQVGW